MKKSLNEIQNSLSQSELDALRSIYDFRCLTPEQIYTLHYQRIESVNSAIAEKAWKAGIRKLVRNELIRKVEFKGERTALFLTNVGIEMIRHNFSFPTNIYDAKKKVIRRGYYRAFELDMYPKHINHQIHLNQFVIDFQLKQLDYPWKYFDEKYVSLYNHIRPDGLLTILDTDFFLEMDMSTESKNQLYDKWDNYRNFLLSREYAYRERRVVVLFIVDGTERLEERIDLIKFTIYERLLDVLDSEFEIFVGTSEQLLLLMEERLLPLSEGFTPPDLEKTKKLLEEKHELRLVDGENLKSSFNGIKYGTYATKILNDRVSVENGRLQEFLIDDYSFSSPTIVSKIAFHEKNNASFLQQLGRELAYVIICNDEEQAYRDLKLIDMIGLSNVYFTTHDRIEKLSFHEALFQYDEMGNLYTFANSGLTERIFEQTFSEHVVKR